MPELNNQLGGLNLNGFSSNPETFDKAPFVNNKIVTQIRPILAQYFQKTKTFYTGISSYGLKHIVERHIGLYVTNGELIYAMAMEGFEFKPNRINCYFNIKGSEVKQFNKLNQILLLLKTPLPDHPSVEKLKDKFSHLKYPFKYIIEYKYQTFKNDFNRKDILNIISNTIGEDYYTVKYLFEMTKGNDDNVSSEKIKKVNELFGL